MSKTMSVIAAVVAVVLILLVGFVIWIIGQYDGFVKLDQDVKEGWAQVESQYQRRLDLLPNMVEVVKQYATHEKTLFTEISEARSRYLGAASGSPEKMKAMRELEGLFARLLVIVENYPQLKANEQFIRLMDQWEGTENRIAVERMRYNEKVKLYNYEAMSFVGRILVSFFGFDKSKTYYEADKAAEKAPSAKELFREQKQ